MPVDKSDLIGMESDQLAQKVVHLPTLEASVIPILSDLQLGGFGPDPWIPIFVNPSLDGMCGGSGWVDFPVVWINRIRKDEKHKKRNDAV
jgi:hypothetical protein